MANVWFLVLVLTFVQNVFANFMCPASEQSILNCDECMRCGGNWCIKPKNMASHCSTVDLDNICAKNEDPIEIESYKVDRNNILIKPAYTENTLFMNLEKTVSIKYDSPVKKNVSYTYNSTQSSKHFELSHKQKCAGTECVVNFLAQVTPGFCLERSTVNEYITVTVKVEDIPEQAVLKYHVPCACACSQKPEPQSPTCTGNGNLTCGVCTCNEGWKGEFCDEKIKCGDRGDTPPGCRHYLKDNVICSGNGECGPCESCVCYKNMTGWQYFDHSRFCSDICMDTSVCQHCLTGAGGSLGECARAAADTECNHDLMLLQYDEAILKGFNSEEWISCNYTYKDPDCYVEYYAQKNNDEITVMVVESCNSRRNDSQVGPIGGGATGSKVPIILGVLAALAAVAALGGVMVWRHLHAVPPMPFSSPDYQNIDAEDCVGENPLYKSPTSTFTNPQFGKCA